MSDLTLTASLDFRQAEAQRDAFVRDTKKKFADIMAAANRPGGSLGGRRGAANILGSVGTDAAKKLLDRMNTLEKAFSEGNIKWRRAIEKDQKLNEAALRKYFKGSNAVRFGRGATKEFIDSMLPNEKAIRDRSRKLRELFEKEAATGTATRRSGNLASFIEQSFGLDRNSVNSSLQTARDIRRQIEKNLAPATGTVTRRSGNLASFIEQSLGMDREAIANANARAAAIRKQIENRLAPATGTVNRQTGTLGSFIERQFGLDTASVNKAEKTARELRARIERSLSPATGIVRRQTGTILDVINNNTSVGTGQQNALRAYYERQAQAAEGAAKRVVDANGKIVSSMEKVNLLAVGRAENTALGVRNRISRQLGESPELQANLTGQLNAALSQYTSTVRSYGARSMEAAKASIEFNKQLQNVRSSIAEHGGLLRTLNKNTETLRGAFTNLGGSLGGLSRLMWNTQVVLSGLVAAFGMREIIQSIQDFERFSNTVKTVSGTVSAFQQNMRYLFGEADRIGFAVGDVGNSFARLSIAMQAAGFSGDQTRSVFTGLTEAARNFGLTSADTMGVVRALEQSMSKGKFMAEEVRLQMGDRLPVAMEALRRAMEQVDGTTVDVNKRFEEGSIDVQRYALAFVQQINALSGGTQALSRTSNTLTAAFGRLSTEFTRFTNALDEGGFGRAVISAADQLRNFMQFARESGALEIFGSALLAVANNFNIFAGAAAAAIAILGGSKFIAALAGITAFVKNLSPVGRVLTGVVTGVTAIGAAFGSSVGSVAASTRTIGQAVTEVGRSTDRVSAQVSDASSAIEQGFSSAAQSAQSNFERLVTSFRQTGESLSNSIRRALEATKSGIEAQIDVTRQSLQRVKREFENVLNTTTGIGNIERQLDSSLRDMSGSTLGAPSSALLEQIGQFRTLIDAIRGGEQPIENIGLLLRDLSAQTTDAFEKATRASDPFAQQFLVLDSLIQTLIRTLGALNNADLTKLREQIGAITGDLAEQIRGLANINSRLNNPSFGADQPADGPAAGSMMNAQSRINWEAFQTRRARAAERNLRDNLQSVGAVGRNTSLGQNPSLSAMLEFVRATPQASAILQRYNDDLKETQGNAGRLSGAIRELINDLTRQAARAGTDTGAAQAFADALNRVEDAADNARGSTTASAAAAEAHRLVTERLNKELERYIKTSARSAGSNNRVAAGFRISSEAGQEAELVSRAYAQALEYAEEALDGHGNATGSYLEAVNRLIPALRELETSEKNLAAARNVSRDRDELQLIEAERSLITARASDREAELAALRARQENRGASPEVIAEAERVARQLSNARRETEQLNNSWNEISRTAEQAFDRIGDAITEAFAKGEISAIDFRNVAKAMISEVIQAMLRMAVLNPVLNAFDGGTRGTLGGVFGSLGAAGGADGVGMLGSFTNLLGIAGSVNSLTGGALTGGLSLGAMLSTPLWGNPIAAAGMFVEGSATSMGLSAAQASAMTGVGPSIGSLLGPAAAGFGAGMLTNTMLGGNQTGGMIGSGIGTAAGIALASAFGGPIGMMGAAILGGAAGGGIGGMFGKSGKGFKGGDVVLALDSSGQLQISRTVAKGFDMAPIAQQLSQEIAEINSALSQFNIRFAGGAGEFAAVGGGQSKNPQSLQEALRNARFTASDPLVAQAVSGATSAQDAVQRAQWVEEVYKQLIQATDGAAVLARAFEDLNAPFEAAVKTAREYGLETKAISEAQSKAIEQFYRANYRLFEDAQRDFANRQAAASESPLLAALAERATLSIAQERNRQDFTDAAKAQGFDDAKIAALLASLEETLVVEFEAINRRVEQTMREVFSTVEDQLIVFVGRVIDASKNQEAAIIQQQRLLESERGRQASALEEFIRANNVGTDLAQELRNRMTQAFEAEANALVVEWQNLWMDQRVGVRGLVERLGNAQASLSGSAMDEASASLYAFDTRSVQEVQEIGQSLQALGLSATEVADALLNLTTAHNMEREAIIRSYEERERLIAESLTDRLDAATASADDLNAILRRFDTQALRERREAAREGLTDMVMLEQVHAAERARIIEDFAETANQSLRQLGGNIRAFLDGLATGTVGDYLSPTDQLNASRQLFDRDLTLAQGGNEEALQRITQTAGTFLENARVMFNSTEDFHAIRRFVEESLGNLPATKNYDALILAELEKISQGTQDQTTTIVDSTGTAIDNASRLSELQLALLRSSEIILTQTNDKLIAGIDIISAPQLNAALNKVQASVDGTSLSTEAVKEAIALLRQTTADGLITVSEADQTKQALATLKGVIESANSDAASSSSAIRTAIDAQTGQITVGNVKTDALANLQETGVNTTTDVYNAIVAQTAKTDLMIDVISDGNDLIADLLASFLQKIEETEARQRAEEEARRAAAAAEAARIAAEEAERRRRAELAGRVDSVSGSANSIIGSIAGIRSNNSAGTAWGIAEFNSSGVTNTIRGRESAGEQVTLADTALNALNTIAGQLGVSVGGFGSVEVFGGGFNTPGYKFEGSGINTGFQSSSDAVSNFALAALKQFTSGGSAQVRDAINSATSIQNLFDILRNYANNGVAFAQGGVFERGRVVDRATMSPMALFGEAGPEAIMPLTRAADGSLGVVAVAPQSGLGDEVAQEIRQLRAEVAALRSQMADADRKKIAAAERISENTEEMKTEQKKTNRKGVVSGARAAA